MLCENCKQRESSVHLTKIVNGQAAQTHLCPECAQQVQGFGLTAYPNMVSDFLQALLGINAPGRPDQPLGDQQQVQCPGCGKTFAQIQETGTMGCSQCYETFETQTELLLRRIHGGGSHVGKIPHRTGATYQNKQQLARLRERLQTLIQKEEFEEAVQVRDRIRDLEKSAGGESQ